MDMILKESLIQIIFQETLEQMIIKVTLMYMIRMSLMTLTRGSPGAMNSPIHTVPCVIISNENHCNL